MKKFIAIAAALSMIATPAFAERRGEYHGHSYENHGHGCGLLCGLIIGGAVVGALSSHPAPTVAPTYTYTPPPPPPQYVCQNIYMRDAYGNYVLDAYGRAVVTQRCWYQ